MNTTAVRIITCTEPTELHRHYKGQTEAQPCYIELDLRTGTLLADYNAEIGNAVPHAVHHGFERRYSVPLLTGDAANRVMEEIRPHAERILADWAEEWNGSNWVARLGTDAVAAEDAICAHLGLTGDPGENQGFAGLDLVSAWELDGAVNGCEASEYGITADTSDERLDEIEAQILSDLAECDLSAEDLESLTERGLRPVAVCAELGGYLRGLRDDAARQDDED